jgi:hypothetical protein
VQLINHHTVTHKEAPSHRHNTNPYYRLLRLRSASSKIQQIQQIHHRSRLHHVQLIKRPRASQNIQPPLAHRSLLSMSSSK